MADTLIKDQLKAIKRAVRDVGLRPESAFRAYLKYKYHVGNPRGYPENSAGNAVLLSQAGWEAAVEAVAALGLALHSDLPKNWDSLVALISVFERTTPQAHILDAGAELYSMILPWLYVYGYEHLTGINLVFDRPIKRGKIQYEYGDITRTRFADQTFDAITCLSVIEHGVDLRAYFREAARILKPGGVIVTSTDYFAEPIDTGGRLAYGVPVHIFCRDEIAEALSIAGEYGLMLTSKMSLDSQEKPIRWQQIDLDYTFIVFTLQKVDQAVRETDGNVPPDRQ